MDGPSEITPHIPKDSANPLLVEVTRDGVVESVHRGRVAIVDAMGKVVRQWGDISAPVFPRSAIKFVQALPLVESGAADACNVSEMELALACASHNGEPRHTDAVLAWLHRIGLSAADLECGGHWPRDNDAFGRLLASGKEPGPEYNNCSGKHTAMLTTAVHLGAKTRGYVEPTHPVQQRILGVLETLCGLDLSRTPRGTDGCSVPNWAVPLENLAFAFAQIAAPDRLSEERRNAIHRIRKAVAAFPEMTAGESRYCTTLMRVTGEKVYVKTGAEGVFCAALPEYGVGIAIKCDDGASRAAERILTAVLQNTGALDDTMAQKLDTLTHVVLKNHRQKPVGEIRPTNHLTF